MPGRPDPFSDPAVATSYAAQTRAKVPGLDDLHRMATLLLAELAPAGARMLVVGAGGGLELSAMAGAQPGWHFTGVDPSPVMLTQARQATAAAGDRIDLIEGRVDLAPQGPYDGATCLLTLHFLDRAERLHTLREIRRRLRPGARLVVAHHAPPAAGAEQWLARSVRFGDPAAAAQAAAAGERMAQLLPLCSPAEEEDLLREAGFSDVALFYAALSFRGWVAVRGGDPGHTEESPV